MGRDDDLRVWLLDTKRLDHMERVAAVYHDRFKPYGDRWRVAVRRMKREVSEHPSGGDDYYCYVSLED